MDTVGSMILAVARVSLPTTKLYRRFGDFVLNLFEHFDACFITQIVSCISPKRLQKVKFRKHALRALCIFIVVFL
jgi:hypothetical protein